MTCTSDNETSSRPPTILVVDDDRSTLNVIGAVIRAGGRSFREASDRAAALEALWENFKNLELLVTDVHSPHLDGLTLVRRARELVPSIKVVVTGSVVDAAERQAIEDLGVTTFLQKPFSALEMTSCIDAVLAHNFRTL